MEYIEQLIDEKSKFISKAEVLKHLGKITQAIELYKKAAGIEYEIASLYHKLKSEKEKIHLISAISCVFESEDYKSMYDWIDKFENIDGINQDEVEIIERIKIMAETKIKTDPDRSINLRIKERLLKFIILQNELKFNFIRGKENIIKEFYEIQKEGYKFGKDISSNYITLRNPIYSPEISKKLDFYLINQFLIRNPDKSININPKTKTLLINEMDMTKTILIKEFSFEFIKYIMFVIYLLGKMNSKELEEYEQKKGITSRQYGRIL